MELELHMPHTLIHKYVDFEIRHYPKDAALRTEYIRPGTRHAFDIINDELVIRDDSDDLKELKKWGLRILAFYFFTIICYLFKFPKGFVSIGFILLSLLFILSTAFLFFYSKYGPKKNG